MKKAIMVVIETILICYITMWILCIETATWEMYVGGYGCLLALLAIARWRDIVRFIVETFL